METTTYPHQEALEDNNFQIKDVPEAIRKRIYGWNARYKSFEKNPTERVKESLLRDSISMADEIQDFAEQDLADETQTQANTTFQNQPDAPAIAGVVNPQSQSELQSAIHGFLSKEGRIYHIDLKNIMGQRSIPDRVEVGELVLTRSFAFYYPA